MTGVSQWGQEQGGKRFVGGGCSLDHAHTVRQREDRPDQTSVKGKAKQKLKEVLGGQWDGFPTCPELSSGSC